MRKDNKEILLNVLSDYLGLEPRLLSAGTRLGDDLLLDADDLAEVLRQVAAASGTEPAQLDPETVGGIAELSVAGLAAQISVEPDVADTPR